MRLCIALNTGLDYLESMPVDELIDIAQEAAEIYGKEQRDGDCDQHRR